MNINNVITNSNNRAKWLGWSHSKWNGKGEDVLQDSLSILWEKLIKKEVKFENEKALDSWIYKTIIKKGKDTDQGRQKINKNSDSLDALSDKGLQPIDKKIEDREDKVELGDVWCKGILSHTKKGKIRTQKMMKDLPLFQR